MKRVSRRGFLAGAASAASGLVVGRGLLTAESSITPSTPSPTPGVLDEALGLLARTGPEYGGGLANHGPMAAEALVALRRPSAVIPWVEGYRRRLREHPESTNAVTRESWREALGEPARVGDWIALFGRELTDRPWKDVLDEWTRRLAPGLAAAAFHGIIRTAHAARGLDGAETRARRRELAEGLGYWAARYQSLPETPSGGAGRLRPSQALARVERLPGGRRRPGFIMESLRPLDDFPPFADAAGLVDTSGDASSFVSDLTETFAGVYLANAPRGNIIGFVHAVTGPSAIRLLLPHVGSDARASLLRHGWQAAAAFYSAFGAAPPGPIEPGAVPEPDGLIDRAVASGDEHGIKFVEACLREHARNPRPVYLHAASHAAQRLGRG